MPRRTAYRIRWGRGLFFVLLACAGAVAAVTLQDLRDEWNAAQTSEEFRLVSKALIEYRVEARYAKTAEVDYMIATSLCRMDKDENRADGYRHFDWILASYSLETEDRNKVEEEQARCMRTEVSATPVHLAFAMLTGQGGASEVRSKLYYWIGREAAAINTEPVRIVRPKTPEELRVRLFEPGANESARTAVSALLGSRYSAVATDNFVLASSSGHSASELREIGANLERYMAFYVSAYRMRYPLHLVTIYLVPDAVEMRQLGISLHGIEVPEQSIGYAFRDDLSILGVIPGKAIGTLAHELFHTMLRDRYGDMPPWLDEGTASLYEVSRVSGKYLPGGRADMPAAGPPMVDSQLAVRGIPNWRGCVIRKLWLEKFGSVEVVRPTLSQLVAMDWSEFNNLGEDEYVAQQAMNHATARYFALYLQEGGKLFDVFADFADRDPMKIKIGPTEDARQRLAEQIGDLELADAKFETWLRDRLSVDSCGD